MPWLFGKKLFIQCLSDYDSKGRKDGIVMLCNVDRLIKMMDKFSLDGVVAGTPANILYLSGFSSWSQRAYQSENVQVYVVFCRDQGQSPMLLIPMEDLGYAVLKEVWIRDICTYGTKRTPPNLGQAELSPEETGVISISEKTPKGRGPEEALAQVLREKGLEKARIGIDQQGVPTARQEMIGSLLPGAEILPGSGFFRYVRMVKTDAEIERLKEATGLNERAASAMLKRAAPGVTEGEVASAYRAEIGRAGGEVFWLHLGAGRAGNFPPIKDRVLVNGEVLRTDMGCMYEGYNADTCRAGCIGTPSDKHRKIFDAVQAGLLRSIDRLKPGVLPSELHETMIQGVRAAGLPKFSYFFVGHTIGLEPREFPFMLGPKQDVNDPFLPPSTDVPMEPGMVINLEAASHEPGWGSVAVEYTLVVTETGNEYLIAPQQHLYSLPLV
jgi:Xaa-Pro aminopeptidase